MFRRINLIAFSGLLLFTISCNEPDKMISDPGADVIIINEGNFSSADGTLSTFNTFSDEVDLSVFASTNGFPLAATIQNAVIVGDKIYAVTNAADKLEVIDLETFESLAHINAGLSTPYSFAASGDKGYLTNWGTYNSETYGYDDPFIAVVDLTNHTISTTIERSSKPQYVVSVGGFFYVSNPDAGTVTVFDATDDQVETDIDVSSGPDRMVIDMNGNIWVICNSGNIDVIDTETNVIEKTITGIQVTGFNEKMTINDSGDKIYYLSSSGWPDYNTSIYEIGLDATDAPSEPLLSGTNYYGIGISKESILYVGDANAFQGNGSVFRYNLEGTEIDQFPAGRGPNGFLFR